MKLLRSGIEPQSNRGDFAESTYCSFFVFDGR